MVIKGINTVEKIEIKPELQKLLETANKIYKENFENECYFEKCIFLSWYCSLGNCDFCYRSTVKEKIEDPSKARRRKESLYAETIIAKKLGWKHEFITGGYGIFPFDEEVEIAKTISDIYQEKIWINLGVLSKTQMEKLKPYSYGMVASIETIEPELQKKVAPGKPIPPFTKMLQDAKEMGLKTGITVILGIGEPKSDYENYVKPYIKENKIDKIVYYSLRPVKGTPYKKGPDAEYCAEWIAKTRIDFPKIEIAYGTAETRLKEISLILKAGANNISKLPSTKMFGTTLGQELVQEVEKSGRQFKSNFTKLPEDDMTDIVDRLELPEERKKATKTKIISYIEKTLKKKYFHYKSILDLKLDEKAYDENNRNEKDKNKIISCEPCAN